MLIEFSVSNFRSIKERQTLSFLPETRFSKEDLSENIIPASSNPYKITLLKSILIYGANASGKSNLLMAFEELTKFIANGDNLSVDQAIPAFQPFLLDIDSVKTPCVMELDFITNDKIRYEYRIDFLRDTVIYEGLFFYPHEGKKRISKAKLFEKIDGVISFGVYYKGKKNFNLYPNQLILSQARKEPIESLTPVYKFIRNFATFATNAHGSAASITSSILAANDFIKDNLKIIADAANLGINDIKITKTEGYADFSAQALDIVADYTPRYGKEKFDTEEKTELPKNQKVEFLRSVYDQDKIVKQDALFGLDMESKGTLAMIAMCIPMLHALQSGGFVAVDIEQNFHPRLHKLLMTLFNKEYNNPHNAQMVFTTHDVSLMDRDKFRLDQILFIDKNNKGESSAYKLSDFEGVTKTIPLKKWYLRGQFGAVPVNLHAFLKI